MIISKLQGGIGNQLFQLAAGYALARNHQTELKLDLSFLTNNSQSTELFTARNYELSVFKNLKFKIATNSETDLFLPKKANLINRILRKIKRIYLKPLIITDNIDCQDFFSKTSINTYLDGYWQNEAYFKEIRNELIELFQFPELPEKYAKTISNNSVSIHFRRGDYVDNKHINSIYANCSLDYYHNAIKYIQERFNNIVLYLFSDDIHWVKENFATDLPVVYVSNQMLSVADELHLMSLCKHHIIANSSFSWWAAWLNQNPDKMIIAPQNWFNDKSMNQKAQEIVPEKWIKL
jgi:hypothetical protein